MNRIKIDTERKIDDIDRNIFGGFAEHVGRCIYGGIFEEDSPLSDGSGFRKDVMEALSRLRFSVIRYPGGNFASGYRWMDGIGPKGKRPARSELAWNTVESNRFGTDEFIQFCRCLGTEPYLVVNCGDGNMREAQDWVEYCNGTKDTAIVRLRRKNGFEVPHSVKYWGIGNEVDGPWQIGMKNAAEYARAFKEYGKVMKWIDPNIKLIASAISNWDSSDWVKRGMLLLEEAHELIDYMSLHWYVGNREGDFSRYMTVSEEIETKLSAYEGLISAVRLQNGIRRPIAIAVDEWNVWYRTGQKEGLEEVYNLEDALVVAIHLNAFIRHARTVRMANLAQIVNVIAPIVTGKDRILLQSIFYPFEIYSRECGDTCLDVYWDSDTFSGGAYSGIRYLDVSANIESKNNRVSLFVVNRHPDKTMETEIVLGTGIFSREGKLFVINGPDIKSVNTFENPYVIKTREFTVSLTGNKSTCLFEPHSVSVLVFKVR